MAQRGGVVRVRCSRSAVVRSRCMSTLTLFPVRWKRGLMHDVRGELEGVWLTRTGVSEPVGLYITIGVAVTFH